MAAQTAAMVSKPKVSAWVRMSLARRLTSRSSAAEEASASIARRRALSRSLRSTASDVRASFLQFAQARLGPLLHGFERKVRIPAHLLPRIVRRNQNFVALRLRHTGSLFDVPPGQRRTNGTLRLFD